ncbi:peptidase M20 domain-containing protein 2 [Trichonephila clavata]|uniref:Peptidase M20 domain-containing protein 2 n=1 Tax=Trichonephila clavata TaxID=2740835 RepID=A0A8X6K612_TRICU|nr:peptidase M20 domain-containing protein 2 [Trichonephila clavata]
MTEEDFRIVCSTIDEEKEFLNSVSQDIWSQPELSYKEFQAHEILTSALTRCGFQVERQYVVPTAFKAEYTSKKEGGPVIAVLLEYDALPDIGHACGHNLIAEVGLATSLAIKAAMDADPKLPGKLLILGTPGEEGDGGKIDLLSAGAFRGVDVAMMAHPCQGNISFPPVLSLMPINVDFIGKEAHAAAFPWEGRNALDAAIAAYQNIALLRQHIKPSNRIHVILTKGGVVPNIIPAESRLEMYARSSTISDLEDLVSRITDCVTSGASAAGCTARIQVDRKHCFENLISNKIMGDLYDSYAQRLGIFPTDFSGSVIPTGSTDMGNVSHVIPSIHPFFDIDTKAYNHHKGFADASGDPKAQGPTLQVAKALAMTALQLMRCPDSLRKVKEQFERDVAQGL